MPTSPLRLCEEDARRPSLGPAACGGRAAERKIGFPPARAHRLLLPPWAGIVQGQRQWVSAGTQIRPGPASGSVPAWLLRLPQEEDERGHLSPGAGCPTPLVLRCVLGRQNILAGALARAGLNEERSLGVPSFRVLMTILVRCRKTSITKGAGESLARIFRLPGTPRRVGTISSQILGLFQEVHPTHLISKLLTPTFQSGFEPSSLAQPGTVLNFPVFSQSTPFHLCSCIRVLGFVRLTQHPLDCGGAGLQYRPVGAAQGASPHRQPPVWRF